MTDQKLRQNQWEWGKRMEMTTELRYVLLGARFNDTLSRYPSLVVLSPEEIDFPG